jgi:tetratricopeptide (TPR) repeat protein
MNPKHGVLAMVLGLFAAGPRALAGAPAAPTTAPAPTAVSPENAKAAETEFDAGRKLFFQGDYQAAITRLTKAGDLDPTKGAYRLLLAKAYRSAGRPKDAAAILERILAADPEHVEAAVEFAEILSPDKQADRVIKVLEPLLKFKHDYPLYHLLAEAYYQKEEFAKARENFEQAVRLNPLNGQDHYQLANIYLAESRFAKAAQSYERALQLGVDSAVLHFKLASVYFNLRNYLGQVTVAEIVGGQVGQIKNDLFLIDPVPGKKDTFYVSGPRSAIFQVAKARALGVDLVTLRFLEANVWLNAGRFAKADAIYKDLQDKLDKGDVGLFWFYWAQTALGLEDLDNYLARLKKAIESEPDTYKATLADAYVAVARRYQQRGDDARYIDFLGKAVETNPLSAGLHLTLGDALVQAGQKAKAAEQYRLVLELEPDHPQRVRLLNAIRGEETTATAPAPKA